MGHRKGVYRVKVGCRKDEERVVKRGSDREVVFT